MNDIDEAYASWDADEKRKRNAIIEECARVVENWDRLTGITKWAPEIAAAIRALKS